MVWGVDSAAKKCWGRAYHRYIAEHAGSKQEGTNDLSHNVVSGQGRVGEALQTHIPIRQALSCQGVLLPGNLSFCCHLEGQVEHPEAILILALEKLGLQAQQSYSELSPFRVGREKHLENLMSSEPRASKVNYICKLLCDEPSKQCSEHTT